ncbi:radical SAM protein, partial [Brunnivagina elsteri]
MNQVDYLRISLIDRCNFRCQYCMPEGTELDYILKQNLLTNEELLTLIKEVFIPVGFTRFRLTGGEPLLRPQIVELVAAISALPETKDLSMTSNGFLLTPLAQSLYNAGLRRINLSLDSLDSDIFNSIIGNRGRSQWQNVWNGIHNSSLNFLSSNLRHGAAVIPCRSS